MRHVARIIAQPNLWLAAALIIAFSVPFGWNRANAASSSNYGFVIHSNSIEGKGMTASIAIVETSKGKRPVLRFHYESATIHGLTMTKVVNTPNGAMTVKITAPLVTAKNMTVDATGFSASGACLKLGKTYPQLVLQDVTLEAQQQKAGHIRLQGATVRAVQGDHGLAHPGPSKVIEGLLDLSLESLKEAIADLMSGHFPLTCGENSENPKTASDGQDPISKTTDQVKDTVEKVKDGLGAVLEPGGLAGDIEGIVDNVKGPIEEILEEKPLQDPVEFTEDLACRSIDELLKRLDDIEQQANQIGEAAPSVLTGLREKRETAANLTQELGELQKNLQSQIGNSLNGDELNELTSLLEQVNSQAEELKQLQNRLDTDRLAATLDALKDRLNNLENQLNTLSSQTICASEQFDETKDEIHRSQEKVNHAISNLHEWEQRINGQMNAAEETVKDIVDQVEGVVGEFTDDGGGGLFDVVRDLPENLLSSLDGVNSLVNEIKNTLNLQ
ncbi:MAG TPA: DUF6230 family protein [Bacillales bacterium]|nr:DUF6230 family protein [Bacillales bacterium]